MECVRVMYTESRVFGLICNFWHFILMYLLGVMRFHFKLCENNDQIKLTDIEVFLASDKPIDILILLIFLGPLEQSSNFP